MRRDEGVQGEFRDRTRVIPDCGIQAQRPESLTCKEGRALRGDDSVARERC
jgi:hypothetical protein